MNTSVASQVEIAVQSLHLDVQNLKKGSEFPGDAISQIVSKSQEALRLAQNLLPQQRAAVEAQALQAQREVGEALSPAQIEAREEEKRKKQYEETIRLIQENPVQNADLIKQQQEKLVEKEAYTKETLIETLRSKLTEREIEEFNVLSGVLEIPGIAKEFMPFEEKAALVNEVFEEEKAAEFLRRDIETSAVHQVLTGYADFGDDMPDLTKSMLDNFRNVEANKAHIEQCGELQKAWNAKCEVLEAEGGREEELANARRAAQEAKNKTTETTTAVNQVSLVSVINALRQQAKAASVGTDATLDRNDDRASNIITPSFLLSILRNNGEMAQAHSQTTALVKDQREKAGNASWVEVIENREAAKSQKSDLPDF